MNFRWAYEGVNDSVPRNTGKECVEFLSPIRRIIETIIIMPICVIAIKWSLRRLKPINCYGYGNNLLNNLNQHQSSTISNTTINQQRQNNYLQHDHEYLNQEIQRNNDEINYRFTHSSNNSNQKKYSDAMVPTVGKQVLLVAMTFTLGIEIGFKFATRTVIYILNPCHITTMMQIYLLASNKPSKTVTVLFRIQMNYLNGPLLAFLFPETDSRQLNLEVATYWIQHALIFIIPIYLLRLGGIYNMEEFSDFNWNIISYGCLILYHFGVLQLFGLLAHVNLNHMLCPAIKDPFDSVYYRFAAFVHQAILCTVLEKIVLLLFSPYHHLTTSTTSSTSTINNHCYQEIVNKNGTNNENDISTTETPSPILIKPSNNIVTDKTSSASSTPVKTLNHELNILIKTGKID
uniref:Putative conserved plasma membrane protein n=1 Tax=Corethrella appendiculata TaxID=1370023 RepID=U5EYN7_9DIPT